MNELNCCYEESKKILELGYDFNKICHLYRKETSSFKMNLFKIDKNIFVYAAPEGESFGDHVDCTYSSLQEVLRAGHVPIVPKAALEACLPEFKDQEWFGHTLFDMETMEYSPDLINIAYSDLRKSYKCDFNSAFEAFIWCHENYPVELKKKFDEVMA
jgi:hypothetical protein